MKKLVLLALTLVLISSAFALGDNVLSDNFFQGDSFVIDDKLYTVDTVKLYATYSEVSLYFKDGYITIRNTSNERTADYLFDLDKVKYDTSRKEREATIKVYRRAPDVKITKSTTVTEMWIGAEATVTATIENTGEKDGDFLFADVYSRDINITDVDNCDEDPYYLQWKINNTWKPGKNIVCTHEIKVNKTKTIQYKITPTKLIDAYFEALVTYFNGYENKTEKSSSVRVNSKYFFELDSMFSDNSSYTYTATNLGDSDDYTKFQIGQDIYFFTQLRNMFGAPYQIENIKFHLSEGLEFVDNHILRKTINTTKTEYYGQKVKKIDKNSYTYSGTLSNTSEYFALHLKAIKDGKQSIRIEVDVLNDNKSYDTPVPQHLEESNEIEVNSEEIEIQTSFEDESFDSGEEYILKFQVVNPNEFLDFKNIHIDFSSDLLENRTINIDSLTNEKTFEEIIVGKLIMPNTTSNKNYKANFNISYYDEFNKKQTEYIKISVPVKAIPDLIITESFSPSTIYEGEDITVTTKIQNKRQIDLGGVQVKEVFDPKLNFKLNISKSADLNRDTTHQVYVYKFKAPEVKENTKFYINTSASYSRNGMNYTTQKQHTITVKNKKLKPSITKSVEDDPFYGSINEITYKIKNTEDEPIFNILVNYPLQEKTDVIGKTFYWVDKLEPEEEIILNREELIRIKYNKSFNLEKTNISFEDRNGITHWYTSNKVSVSPGKGSLNDAAIIVNKTAPSKTNLSEEAEIKINVKNIGTKAASVKILDHGKEFNLDINPNSKQTITHKIKVDKVGKTILEEAIASYVIEDLTYYTATNQPTINIINDTEPIIVKEEAKTEEKPSIIEEETPEKIKKQNKMVVVVIAIIIVAFLLVLMLRPMKPRKFEFKQ